MPEGHTLFRLAADLDHAFAGLVVTASSPQGRFAAGADLVNGTVLEQATSWGKHLFLEFPSERWVHVHLGLIGTFAVGRRGADGTTAAEPSAPGESRPDPPIVGQVRLRLLNDAWVADLRGPNVCAVLSGDEVAAILDRLGPDPLRDPDDGGDGSHADTAQAWAKIHRSGKTIAELLMDQSVLAGVGNVYRCEVLFRNRVHPMRTGKQLRSASWDAIWADLRRLMPLGVATGRIVTIADQVEDITTALGRGDPVDLDERESYVYRRAGEACLICGSRVRSAPIAGRTLYWCGNCQRRS